MTDHEEKRQAHAQRAQSIEAEVVNLCGGTDNPRIDELVKLLRALGTHSYLRGLAEVSSRVEAIYAFESYKYPPDADEVSVAELEAIIALGSES